MPDLPWIHRLLAQPVTATLSVALVLFLLVMSILTFCYVGYGYWLRQKGEISVHMGYFRYALLLALLFASTAFFMVRDFYESDGLHWLTDYWLPGILASIPLGLLIVLLAKWMTTHTLQAFFYHLDFRLGDDDDHLI